MSTVGVERLGESADGGLAVLSLVQETSPVLNGSGVRQRPFARSENRFGLDEVVGVAVEQTAHVQGHAGEQALARVLTFEKLERRAGTPANIRVARRCGNTGGEDNIVEVDRPERRAHQ